MSDLAILAENVCKRYVLGNRSPYRTLKETLADAAQSVQQRVGLSADPDERSSDGVLWALRDVSFQVRTGEVLGVIGRNGAGKSTLLRILSRITSPSAGRAEIWGSVAALLGIGTGFHGDLTGRENVFLNGALLGMSPAELRDKFDAIVDFADLGRFIDTPIKRYSSGMNSRLAFAVAAFLDPDILLVDEVLAAGDANFQAKCTGKIAEVAEEGRTVVFVSHSMAAIQDLTTRCLFLQSGRIVVDDDPKTAINAYLGTQHQFAYRRNLRSLMRGETVADGRRWEFTFVAIDAPQSGLRANQPLQIDVDFRSHSALGDVAVEVSVCHCNGTRLISTHSDDGGLRFHCAAGQAGTIRVLLESPRLPPGEYLLELSAKSGSMHVVDVIPEALCFEIIPDADDPLALSRRAERNLGLRMPARWEVQPGVQIERTLLRQKVEND